MFRKPSVILWLTILLSLPAFGQSVWTSAGADVARNIPGVAVEVYRTSRETENERRRIEAQRQIELERTRAEERVRTAQVMTDAGLSGIQTRSSGNGTTVSAGQVIGTPYERMQESNNTSQVRIAQIQAEERRQQAADQRQFSYEEWRRNNGCPEDRSKPCTKK